LPFPGLTPRATHLSALRASGADWCWQAVPQKLDEQDINDRALATPGNENSRITEEASIVNERIVATFLVP